MSRSCLLTLNLLLLSAAFAAAHGGGHGGDDDSDADATTPPSSEPINLRSRSLILVKIWCLIIVFASTFIGGMSPYFMRWNEGFLVIGTQFAGGVFLATALMHFLSDANETFGDLTSVQYPFAFMLACAGYLLTMLADCIVGYFYGKSDDVRKGDGGNSHTNADVEVQENAHISDGNHNPLPSKLHDRKNEPHSSKPSLPTTTSFGDNILLISALCFHSVFEGIAIGVAQTKSDAWRALWTVSLHKVFAAVAMGIALLRMIPNRPLLSCMAYAFAFAISSPIGVAIGIVIDATTQGKVADWIFAVSMGLACGVFIYVSINHLLSSSSAAAAARKEAVGGGGGGRRSYGFLAVVLGVGVIAVVMIWDT